MKEVFVLLLVMGLVFFTGCVTSSNQESIISNETQVIVQADNISSDLVSVGSDLSDIISGI